MLENDARLRQTLRLLNILSEDKNMLVAALDPEFRYTYFNQSYFKEMQRLTGKSIKLGMSMPDTLAHMPEQQKIAVEEWTPVFRGERTDKTVRFGDANLYQRVYHVKHIPIKDDSGRVIGACEVANEISDQYQAEIALKRAKSVMPPFLTAWVRALLCMRSSAMKAENRWITASWILTPPSRN